MSEIPEAAVLAAFEVLMGRDETTPTAARFALMDAEDQAVFRGALEAAAPFIRAQVAAEVRPLTPSDEEWQANIKAYQKARGDSDVPTDWDFAFWDAGYKAAIRKAAQIAERSGQ